ncbi:unnamed protein product [Mytilus coruscus]|uniref:Retrotransposon gag domain-containing protein n=1 Tax=Mytilus coruscus TaxID=42192 RepID=A0A6J8EYF9_MYTCO|nr:unnamed protein product [Mytilus coruscus]
MSDFVCDDNETPQLLKPREESPDREIMFRRNLGPSGSGTAGDDDEAGQDDVPIRDEYRSVGENFYRKEYPLVPNQRDFPDRNPNIRGNNPDFNDQIPPYNGKDSWEEYISHFKNCADLGRWKESEKVLLLAASLRGPARTFYISLTSTEKKSYCLLVRTLEQRFGNARHQNRWLSRFETRTRQPQEPIANFGDDLRQMAQKVYSNLDTRAQEVLALNQLFENIILVMKCRYIDKDCRSVTEAVDLIKRYEALLGDPNDKKGKIDRLEHSSNSSQTPQRGPRTCFTCNSPDHFYRNGPLHKRQAGPNQASPPNSNWAKNSPSYQRQRSGNNPQIQGNGYPSAH